MRFRRLLAAVLAVVTVLSGMCLSAHAANTCSPSLTCDTIYELPEKLEIFKTVAQGSIKAVKKNGSWYYQFTRSGQTTVYIKATAFMTKPTRHRHLDWDNKVLNQSLAADSNHGYKQTCYYNTTTVYSRGDHDSYTTNMYQLELCAGGADAMFVTKCKLTRAVQFTYDTMVPVRMTNQEMYRKGFQYEAPGIHFVVPDEESEYMAALTRSTNVRELVPTTTVGVTNTGRNGVYLSMYRVAGVGKASTGSSAAKGLLDLAVSAESLGKSVKTAVESLNFFSAWGVVSGVLQLVLDSNMKPLDKTSTQYNTGECAWLSRNRGYVYKAGYTSPIKLARPGDWMQVETYCNRSVGDAKFNVQFSF